MPNLFVTWTPDLHVQQESFDTLKDAAMRTLTLSAIFLATAALAADPAPKAIPGLKAVQDAYDKELLIAKELFSRSTKEARAEYQKSLKAIQTERTKAGDLDGAIKVKEMIAGVDGDESTDLLGKPRVPQAAWAVTYYPNKTTVTYLTDPSGKVTRQDTKALVGQLKPHGAGFAMVVGGGKVEKFTFTPGRVFIEHFNPGDTFGRGGPDQVGIGEMVKK